MPGCAHGPGIGEAWIGRRREGRAQYISEKRKENEGNGKEGFEGLISL